MQSKMDKLQYNLNRFYVTFLSRSLFIKSQTTLGNRNMKCELSIVNKILIKEENLTISILRKLKTLERNTLVSLEKKL